VVSVSIFDSGFEKRRFTMKSKIGILVLALLLFCGVTAANPLTEPLPLPPFPLAAAMLPPPTGHAVVLTWTASTSAASCVAPACTFGYNVFKGTVAGAESATPLNSAPLTALTYTDSITLTSAVQSVFYFVEAVETASGITVSSVPSNEVSATFPGIPAAPVLSETAN
jgi:hypothetical protein